MVGNFRSTSPRALRTFLPAALLAALCATPAIAEPDNPGGPYVGAGWGQFNLDIKNLDDAGTAASSIAHSNDNAWKLFAGYRFNPYVALEAAYIDFGQPSDNFSSSGSNGNYRVDISGFAPTVVGSLPIGPVELFAKIG